MEEISFKVLENYGFSAFLVVVIVGFAGMIIHKILIHFMNSIEAKDGQIVEIGNRFSLAIENHTRAINELSKAEIALAENSARVSESFERFQEQTSREHEKILDYVAFTRNKN